MSHSNAHQYVLAKLLLLYFVFPFIHLLADNLISVKWALFDISAYKNKRIVTFQLMNSLISYDCAVY